MTPGLTVLPFLSCRKILSPFSPSGSAIAAAAWHVMCHCNLPLLANNGCVGICGIRAYPESRNSGSQGAREVFGLRRGREMAMKRISVLVGTWASVVVVAGVCLAAEPRRPGNQPAAGTRSVPPNNSGFSSVRLPARRPMRRPKMPPIPPPAHSKIAPLLRATIGTRPTVTATPPTVTRSTRSSPMVTPIRPTATCRA